MGLLFEDDICPWRGRAHIGQIPALAEKVGKILALKEQYRKFFYDGQYTGNLELHLPASVKYGEFVNEGQRMYALWNDSDKEITVEIENQTITLGAQEVGCVCLV